MGEWWARNRVFTRWVWVFILCFMGSAVLEGVVAGVLEVPAKAKQPGSFEPNDPRLAKNVRARRKAELEAERNRPIPPRAEVDRAWDPLLTAYRHVLANEDGRVDGTIVEREVRALLASHRKEFLAKWSEMEQEERSFADRKSAEAGVEEDVGLEAAVGLLDRVLAEGIE